MGFYERLTPFQQGLVSVLMVAIPYFIAMVIIYVYFGLFASGSERCESLCCYHRMKLIESRMNSTQPPDFVKFTGHPEDYYFENDEVNTKSTKNSIVLLTLPSFDDSLQWERYVVEGTVKSEKGDFPCPAALVNRSVIVTGDGCNGDMVGMYYQIGTIKKNIIDERAVRNGGMYVRTIEEFLPSELEQQKQLSGTKDDLAIQFTGWNPKTKEKSDNTFRFNNTITCSQSGITYSANDDDGGTRSCLVVHPESEFSASKNDIMVGSNAQLIGIYHNSKCVGNSCLIFYHNTTRYKTAILDKIKDLFKDSQ